MDAAESDLAHVVNDLDAAMDGLGTDGLGTDGDGSSGSHNTGSSGGNGGSHNTEANVQHAAADAEGGPIGLVAACCDDGGPGFWVGALSIVAAGPEATPGVVSMRDGESRAHVR